MWAYGLTAPNVFGVFDVPAPVADDLRDGQVILRVLVGGICGSDLPMFKGKIAGYDPTPRVGQATITRLGCPLHEVVGEVVATRDETLPVGARVVGWASQSNGLSELIVVEGADVITFSVDLAPWAAIMLQPLACVLYAVDALTDVDGASAAVIGQGPIGVLFSHVLKSRGAAHVTGVDRIDRSNLAAVFGMDEALFTTSDRWAELVSSGDAREPEIVVEAVGHQVSTLVDAIRSVREEGQIYYFGIPDDPIYPFPMTSFLRKNARLLSGYTLPNARRDVLRRADEYLAKYPQIIEPYITSRYPFTQATEAYTTACTPNPGQLKVILET